MAGRGVDIKLGEGVRRRRRPLRARHRAPRVAADRQPAPRPLGPPGRSGRVALLPLRRGRPRPPVRRRPDQEHHGALQDPGRPAHGGEDPLEPDRGRAEEGRGAELRRAQERPQVRRRDEQAAHGDLRAAPRASSRARTCRSRCSSGSTRSSRRPSSVHAGASTPRNGISKGSSSRWRPLYETEITVDELREELSRSHRESLIEEFQEDARDEYNAKERGARRPT